MTCAGEGGAVGRRAERHARGWSWKAVQFHSHDRLKLSVALATGLAVAVLIGQFETSGHDHEPTVGVSGQSQQG